jgi:hypothetical protein
MLWPPRGVYTDFASNSRTGLHFRQMTACDCFVIFSSTSVRFTCGGILNEHGYHVSYLAFTIPRLAVWQVVFAMYSRWIPSSSGQFVCLDYELSLWYVAMGERNRIAC